MSKIASHTAQYQAVATDLGFLLKIKPSQRYKRRPDLARWVVRSGTPDVHPVEAAVCATCPHRLDTRAKCRLVVQFCDERNRLTQSGGKGCGCSQHHYDPVKYYQVVLRGGLTLAGCPITENRRSAKTERVA